MTMARSRLVDPSVTRWYHCITRCVRRAFLLGEGANDRKQWIGDDRRHPSDTPEDSRAPIHGDITNGAIWQSMLS